MIWDSFARQSDRLDRYDDAVERLKAAGRLYPCYETADELALKRKSLLSRGLPPLYDRAALRLSDADRARLEAEGRRPHWRFKLEAVPVEWNDLVRGPQHLEGRDLSDPVLTPEDTPERFSETVVRLPHWCYFPPPEAAPEGKEE